MTEGFILSNKYRKAVFTAFVSGETDVALIAKKYHIVPSVAHRVTQELLEIGILEKNGDRYHLTSAGERLALTLQG